MDSPGGERRREDAAQPDKAAGGAKADPADREYRRRNEGGEGEDPLARQPRRAPLREGAPGPLRPPEMKDRRDQSASGQHKGDQQSGDAEPAVGRQ